MQLTDGDSATISNRSLRKNWKNVVNLRKTRIKFHKASKYTDIKIQEGCHEAIRKLKSNNSYKYLIFAIRSETSLSITHMGQKSETCGTLLNNLKSNQCRYILYYHHDVNCSRLPKRDGPVLIAWMPKVGENAETEMYSRALTVIKTILEVDQLLIVDDVENVSASTLEDYVQKSVDCSFHKNVIRTPPMDYVPDSRGLGFVYYQCMLKNKNSIAQVEGLTGKTKTYSELLQNSTNVAIYMRKKGVKAGDVVSICSYEQENSAIPFLATLFLGATTSAIDTSFSLDEVKTALGQIMPKIIFVVPEVVDRITTALAEIKSDAEVVVFGSAGTHTSFLDLVQPSGENIEFQPATVKSLLETAFIIFTSGSTGVPKTVCHNHYSVLYQYYNFKNTQFCWDLILHYATPYWTVYSKFLGIAILSGTARLIYPTFYANYWHFTNYKVTTAFLSTTELLTLIKQERPKNVNLQGLKIVFGGNVINDKQMQELERVFYDVDIYFSYGFSEIPDGISVFKPNSSRDLELKNKYPTSVGLALSGISYKVVSPETDEILPANEQGELRIKTSFPFGGYYKMDSSPLLDTHGWLKTGDIAYYNEDLCLYIVGRLKEMFKYKDYHIVPIVLENILQSHPAVQKAAVIGIPHDEDGHHPLGIVTLKTSQAGVTPQILTEYVNGKVEDPYRLRAGVEFVAKLPTTSTGKIRKWLLKEMFVGDC